ncbi:MAG: hypothetical protein ABTQ26_11865 [Azonexus sp.]
MQIVVLKSHPAHATQNIEGIYQELSTLLAGSPLSETDGMIYSIEPDSRESYVKINVDRLKEIIGRLGLATNPIPKYLLRDQRKQAK